MPCHDEVDLLVIKCDINGKGRSISITAVRGVRRVNTIADKESIPLLRFPKFRPINDGRLDGYPGTGFPPSP